LAGIVGGTKGRKKIRGEGKEEGGGLVPFLRTFVRSYDLLRFSIGVREAAHLSPTGGEGRKGGGKKKNSVWGGKNGGDKVVYASGDPIQ